MFKYSVTDGVHNNHCMTNVLCLTSWCDASCYDTTIRKGCDHWVI